MKKLFLAALLAFAMLLPLCACKNQDETSLITDLRTDIYTAQTDTFTLTAYAGRRETPFAADGRVGKVEDVLFLRLNTTCTDVCSVSVECDGQTYVADFATHPVTHNLSAVIPFPYAARKTLNATVTCGESQTAVTLENVTPQTAITYQKALSLAKKSFETDLSQPVEYHVRLLRENDAHYWFCAVVTANGSEAVLLAATDGKLVAKKNFPTK